MDTEKHQEKIIKSFYQPELEFEVKRDLYRILESESSFKQEDVDLDPLYDRICNTIAENEKLIKRKRLIHWVKYAASSAAIFVFGVLFYVLFVQSYFNQKDKMEFTFIAPSQSISETILPDGTRIFLNSNSKIRYHLNTIDDVREVFLNGEAWFDVRKNSRVPFVVHTSNYRVLVHGTKFNVCAYGNKQEVVTTLQEGSIEILPVEGKKNISSLKLKPGQQFTLYKSTGSVDLKNVQAGFSSLWKEPEVRFENKSFKDLLTMLEGRYNVHFVVKDPELFNYHYDGTIRNEALGKVLDILKETLPFRYVIEEKGIIHIEKQ
ncbi:fec operon regulator FecR [compost metagenome]